MTEKHKNNALILTLALAIILCVVALVMFDAHVSRESDRLDESPNMNEQREDVEADNGGVVATGTEAVATLKDREMQKILLEDFITGTVGTIANGVLSLEVAELGTMDFVLTEDTSYRTTDTSFESGDVQMQVGDISTGDTATVTYQRSGSSEERLVATEVFIIGYE